LWITVVHIPLDTNDVAIVNETCQCSTLLFNLDFKDA
jgi:hypothetical protein